MSISADKILQLSNEEISWLSDYLCIDITEGNDKIGKKIYRKISEEIDGEVLLNILSEFGLIGMIVPPRKGFYQWVINICDPETPGVNVKQIKSSNLKEALWDVLCTYFNSHKGDL